MTYPVVFNAEIESADIRFDRGFILTCWITLKWEDAGQGIGGYVLGGSPFDETAACAAHQDQPNLAADFIGGMMAVGGVEKFSDLKGKIVRVGKSSEWGDIVALGHPVKDRWYEPKERFCFLLNSRDADAKGGSAETSK